MTRRRRPARQPGPGEFALVIAVLFILGRSPVLFFRQRTDGIFGGGIVFPWQDDAILRTVFFTAEAIVLVVAIRACGLKSLRRQWALLVFLGFIVLSTVWSVQPDITSFRAMGFVGTAAVGWYLGERFEVRQQAFIVAATAAVGALTSLAALSLWPDLARSTNGVANRWSGVYVNRNLLGTVMAFGLLALPFVLRRQRPWIWPATLGIGLLEIHLFRHSGSRTGLLAGVAAVGLVGFVGLIRFTVAQGVTARGGAVATALAGAVGAYVVHHNWGTLMGRLGRDVTLTRRTEMWAIDRHFLAQKPWAGWGFEAIWTHPPAVEQALVAFRSDPLQAHNGYLEILLGVGTIGFGLFLVFLAVTVWRVFCHAWNQRGLDSLWPLGVATFVLVTNFSESFFIANEALWALLVAAGVTAARSPRPPRQGGGRAASGTRR
jgi:O-antigen ligase